MYTIEDIRQIAIQIERNGEQAYRSAARMCAKQEVEKILIWMAEEEHRHRKWFESLPLEAKEVPKEFLEMEAMGRSLLKEMVEDKTFSLDGECLHSAPDVIAVLSQSLDFEKDTILFYEMLKAFMEDQGSAAQLEKIIEEERGHADLLKKTMDKIIKGERLDLKGAGL